MTVPVADLMPKTIHMGELPKGDNMVFRDSSFFKKNESDLPSPKEIREKGIEIHGYRARSERPPPVLFKEQGLIVKYGSEITTAEARTLWYFNRYMKDAVPTPELFGWCHDNGEVFIYMEYVHGDTLQDAWPTLTQEEQDTICEELRTCVDAWRCLRQETEPYYIGHVGRQGVGEVIFSISGDAHAGPFASVTQFHDFFALYACLKQPGWNPRRDFPELAGLTDDRAVVFTHADLHRSNIIVTPKENGSPRRLAAIIDWHQSGWYPSGWEWLKAYWTCPPLEFEPGHDSAWLSRIMAPADWDYLVAFEFITGTLGY